MMGKPDFVFRRKKLAVFLDGCFWHCCPKHSQAPRNNAAFWDKKLRANRRRDRLVNRTLKEMGWRVVRLWEHDLQKFPAKCLSRIRKALADEHFHS